MSDLALAALLAITILFASMVSIEIGLSVALIELAAGVAVGNLFTVAVPDWLSFVGTFAGVMLTPAPTEMLALATLPSESVTVTTSLTLPVGPAV